MRPALHYRSVIRYVDTVPSGFISVLECARATRASRSAIRVVLQRLVAMRYLAYQQRAFNARHFVRVTSRWPGAERVEREYEWAMVLKLHSHIS
jgi:hypothetical protein